MYPQVLVVAQLVDDSTDSALVHVPPSEIPMTVLLMTSLLLVLVEVQVVQPGDLCDRWGLSAGSDSRSFLPNADIDISAFDGRAAIKPCVFHVLALPFVLEFCIG
jgi:hypothetical protein